mmetsp:Transcript_5516/g.34126  ORF Transcript_5516/g.34126 Transcript_5516/m.34126 type:complete len:315 (+) Transcript_5516:791-1735(+)
MGELRIGFERRQQLVHIDGRSFPRLDRRCWTCFRHLVDPSAEWCSDLQQHFVFPRFRLFFVFRPSFLRLHFPSIVRGTRAQLLRPWIRRHVLRNRAAARLAVVRRRLFRCGTFQHVVHAIHQHVLVADLPPLHVLFFERDVLVQHGLHSLHGRVRRASRHVLLLPKGVQRAHASFFFQVLRHQLRRFRHQPTLALPRPNANHTSRFPRPNRNLARRAHAPPPSSCSSSSSSSSCCCSTSSPPSSSCCCSSPPSSSTSSSSSSSSLERYATSGTVATDGRTRTCDDGWMRLRESPRPSWTMPQGGSAVVRRRTWR